MKLVHVAWIDSQGGGGWKDMKQAVRDAEDETMECESVGWLLADTGSYLLIAPNITTGGDRQVCDPIQIPRCAVSRVRELVPGRTRR